MIPERVRIDPADVIHETLDGEVILIALHSGCYYSLEGSGAEIWDGLKAGRSTTEVAEELERRYAADAGAIPAAVDELVARLVEEHLVVPADDGPAPPSPAAASGN